MFVSGPDRGPPTALRGWLSDVYFPALLEAASPEQAIDALAGRLGAKATIDDPLLGRAAGMPAIGDHLKKTAEWLASHRAAYERVAFTTGIDRDVTEGTLSLALESKTVVVPVAVVAERRKSREVELRVYYPTKPFTGRPEAARAPLLPVSAELLLTPPLDAFVDALSRGDAKAVLATFESDGILRDARGLPHANGDKSDGGLAAMLDGAVSGGVALERGGAADDGRTCAFEYTLVRARGRDVPPRAGMMVFERGDSALIRALRLYAELEA